MTNDEINRAVALELGWVPFHCTEGAWTMVDRAGSHVGKNFKGGLSRDHCWAVCNQNFCTDYNAAAEMRRSICSNEQKTFVNCLARVGAIPFPNGTFDLSDYVWMGVESTPRQQAEAFLRMRGKWVEGAK